MSFLTFSELQYHEDGVSVVSLHRDAVEVAVRASTRRPRQFRDGVGATQVREMQKMFIEGKEAPPIAHNLPPIAGALTWCRGL